MPGSIPASVIPESGGPAPAAARRRTTLRRLLRNPAALVGLVLMAILGITGVLADVLAPSPPFRSVGPPLAPPSTRHLMGTDDLGRDVLSGVIHGARTSLLVVAGVLAVGVPLGLGVGAVAGFRPGRMDDVLMRLTEIVQSMPRFFLAILAVALFGAGLANLVAVLGLTSWPLLARVVRAETLSVREREFVEAARSLGASERRILVRHVLPAVAPPALVIVSLTAASVILLEASVGFLGLGDPAAMSWGYLASNAQRFLRVAWWLSVFPGTAIILAVLGLNLLADGISDALNPFSGDRPRRRDV